MIKNFSVCYNIIDYMKTVENRNILVVEDNDALRVKIYDYFSPKNNVFLAKNLKEARIYLDENIFSVIILDLVLPDGSGFSLLEYSSLSSPVIILSDLNSDENILHGLDYGVADYIVKPVSMEVLEAKIALRLLPEKESLLCLHGMKVDVAKRTAFFKGIPIELTSSEFNILAFLMRHAGCVYAANDLYESIWHMPHLNTQTIRIHLHNLRKKLLLVSPECGSLIMTEFGKGYFFRGE